MKRILISLIICGLCEVSAISQHKWTVQWQGVGRSVLVDFPSSRPGQTGLPVVFVLHGWGLPILDLRDSVTQFHVLGDSVGFITVYPQAIDLRWNSGIGDNKSWPVPNVDDVGFISRIIDSLITRYAIDEQRVYCCGLSNGGIMSLKLAAQLSHRIAAVASVVGTMTTSIGTGYSARRPVPVLMINGTADKSVPYDGGVTNWYSVRETINFWITMNNCFQKPDSLALPDLDPNDQCTVVRYTYRSSINTSEVQLLKVINGGHTWPSPVSAWEGLGATNRDINANREIWNFFKRFSRGPVGVTYAQSVAVDHRYARPGKDTVCITTVLANPQRHVAGLSAIITDTIGTMRDSVLFYNDGLHGDRSAGDSVWGCRVRAPSTEDVFSVSVLTADSTQGTVVRLPNALRIFTNGPIVYKGWTSTTSDTVPRPGNILRLRILLASDGKSAKVREVTASVSPLDTMVFIGSVAQLLYGDIAPGEQSLGTSTQALRIQSYCPPNTKVRLLLKIFNQGFPLWSDTISMTVQGAATEVAYENGVPAEFSLGQNYPNPFNPKTSFEFGVSGFGFVAVRVFDLLGREVAVLVNEEKAPGRYRVIWDAGNSPSGVYFYRVQAGEFMATRRMTLIR